MDNLRCLDVDFCLFDLTQLFDDDANYLLSFDNLANNLYFSLPNGFGIVTIGGHVNKKIDFATLDVICGGIVDLTYLSDQELLAAVCSSGIVVSFENHTQQLSIGAEIDARIHAASWSPDLELCVVFDSERNLRLLNRDFLVLDVIAGEPESFGSDALVTVGWGKKETQFQGTAGKHAAFEKQQEPTETLDSDDKQVKIVWRGDGLFFVVFGSAFYNFFLNFHFFGIRIGRVWSREGQHVSTLEPVSFIEGPLAWIPKGTWIASAQHSQKLNCHQVIFFEKNGLRHNEFSLPFPIHSVSVQKLSWNLDSSVLAILLNDLVPSGDQLDRKRKAYFQLWTVSNYHWYLKQSVEMDFEKRLINFIWDPENALTLHCVSTDGIYMVVSYSWLLSKTTSLSGKSPAAVAVISGKKLDLSFYRYQCVPPPMATHQLIFDDFVLEVSFFDADIAIVVFWNRIAMYRIGTTVETWRTPPQLVGKVLSFPSSFMINGDTLFQWCQVNAETLVSIRSSGDSRIKSVVILDINYEQSALHVRHEISLENRSQCLLFTIDKNQFGLHTDTDVEIFSLNDHGVCEPSQKLSLPHFCNQLECVNLSVNCQLIVGFSSQRYQVSILDTRTSMLHTFNAITSFSTHDLFLLLTTMNHKLLCIPYTDIFTAEKPLQLADCLPSAREVERGSRLVISVPGTARTVLSLPRGNIETINPRSLVIAQLKTELDSGQYLAAIKTMRTERVNMNLIFDHSPKLFVENVQTFVSQVQNADLMNLFLSDLKSEDVCRTMYSGFYRRKVNFDGVEVKNKVSMICEMVLEMIEKLKIDSLFTSLLTCHCKMEPPKLGDALERVRTLKDSTNNNDKNVELALKHLLYMNDVDVLFNAALGVYDFDLVLMVAEKSQKDPKEFLPFLNELRALTPPEYMKFTIDVHLKRFDVALRHLVECGDEKFDECVEFVKKHDLYKSALMLYPRNGDCFMRIATTYGEYLMSKKMFSDAGLSFELANELERAFEAYSNALMLDSAISVSSRLNFDAEKMEKFAITTAEKLISAKRSKEATQILKRYCHKTDLVLSILVKYRLFTEARAYCYEISQPELIKSMVAKELVGFYNELLVTLNKQLSLFEEQTYRLLAIRADKKERFEKWLEDGGTQDDLEACETFSEASSILSSRSAGSRSSKASSASSQRKHPKKRISLRKGTAYEDLAVLQSLASVFTALNDYNDEIRQLLVVLVQCDYLDESSILQNSYANVIEILKIKQSEIWPIRIEPFMLPGPLHEALFADELPHSDEKRVNYSDFKPFRYDSALIPPKLSEAKWKLDLL